MRPANDGAPDPTAEGDAPSLQDRLGRLEEIVRRLEADDLELESALSLFEEGVEHVRRAEQILRTAELRVEELLGPADGLLTRPLEEESG